MAFISAPMRFLVLWAAVFVAALPGVCSEPKRPLERAPVLPLALDDAIQFRKVKLFLNDPRIFKPTREGMISFERQAVNFKAVTNVDRLERRGHYFTFFWRADRRA